MNIQKLASFTRDGMGGNPAGVVIGDTLPTAEKMQAVAAEVGYSETAFAAPEGTSFRTRYFAPGAEVPFCGHATIALGAALGQAFGAGRYDLALNDAEIAVEAYQEDGHWGARLTSPATSHADVPAADLAAALDLFGLQQADLDPAIPPARIHGGAQHLLIALVHPETLADMAYNLDTGARLMQAQGLVTINLIWRETPARIHSRNPFAGHGVYEDPATGAAAAALAGYLRDAGIQTTQFEVVQGVDMGVPSRLWVEPQPGQGAPVKIAGLTRPLA